MRMIGFNQEQNYWRSDCWQAACERVSMENLMCKSLHTTTKPSWGTLAKNVEDQQMARLIRVNVMREWQGIVDIIGHWMMALV